jgi:hypothetical protein
MPGQKPCAEWAGHPRVDWRQEGRVMAGTKPGHDVGKGLTSMKRAFVFLLLAPTSVAFAVWLKLPAVHTGPMAGLSEYIAAVLFLLTFLVSAITGPIDGYLSRALAIPWRAPLIAIVGAATAAGVVLVLASLALSRWTMPPQGFLMLIAIAGALCMGACSALSNNYRGPKWLCSQTSNALSHRG